MDQKKPAPADLTDLDGLVFDIQDIGVRYYTFISTLGLVLEAAAEAKKSLTVLDRPNPIGGQTVAGPVRDPDLASFIAYHALPIRHGMTVGEVARLFNGERRLGAHLEVVPCRGWSRDQTYDQTGLVWTNPSPNMRSLTEAMLYPGVGGWRRPIWQPVEERTRLSSALARPWIEPSAFAAALNSADIPGARFVPIWFVPRERQYKGERCGGVQITIVNWEEFEPMKLGLALALTLRAHYPTAWKPEGLLKMLADRAAFEAILAGKSAAAIESLWRAELDEFQLVRRRYLIHHYETH